MTSCCPRATTLRLLLGVLTGLGGVDANAADGHTVKDMQRRLGDGGLPHPMYTGVTAAIQARMSWSANLSTQVRSFLDSPRAIKEREGPPRQARHEHDPNLAHTHLRFEMLGPVGPTCRGGLGKWGQGDGEKRACALEQAAAPCTVVSIGSNNEWDFEVAVVKRTPCRVETFDCTVGPTAHPPVAWSRRIQLHRICIGERSATLGGQEFMAWEDVMRHLGLSAPPVFLKMDVEGFEYGILEAMVGARRELLPLQIALEVHYGTQMSQLSWYRRWISAAEIALFMDRLWRMGGYLLADRHDNPYCKHCTEVLLVRPRAAAAEAR